MTLCGLKWNSSEQTLEKCFELYWCLSMAHTHAHTHAHTPTYTNTHTHIHTHAHTNCPLCDGWTNTETLLQHQMLINKGHNGTLKSWSCLILDVLISVTQYTSVSSYFNSMCPDQSPHLIKKNRLQGISGINI